MMSPVVGAARGNVFASKGSPLTSVVCLPAANRPPRPVRPGSRFLRVWSALTLFAALLVTRDKCLTYVVHKARTSHAGSIRKACERFGNAPCPQRRATSIKALRPPHARLKQACPDTVRIAVTGLLGFTAASRGAHTTDGIPRESTTIHARRHQERRSTLLNVLVTAIRQFIARFRARVTYR
jgi:hypothetical protein